MELNNVGFAPDVSQEYPLLDPFLVEVGEIKLEIHRIRNRANVIKSFYQHMRSTKNHIVRRELEDKVNADVDVIMTSLAKIQSSFAKWETQKGTVEMGKAEESLKDVLAEYQNVLEEHRGANMQELKSLLKATRHSYAKNMSSVNQNHLSALDEQNHIEIEERYAELLRTDIALRNLKTKFGHWLSATYDSEHAVLQISQFMDQTFDLEDTRPSPIFKTIILASFLGLSGILIIIMLFLLL